MRPVVRAVLAEWAALRPHVTSWGMLHGDPAPEAFLRLHGGGLDTMLRVRWAVQADYFARRLTEDDLTGLADRSGNLTGLHDARRSLVG